MAGLEHPCLAFPLFQIRKKIEELCNEFPLYSSLIKSRKPQFNKLHNYFIVFSWNLAFFLVTVSYLAELLWMFEKERSFHIVSNSVFKEMVFHYLFIEVQGDRI